MDDLQNKFKQDSGFLISNSFSTPTLNQKDHIDLALRTYVSWLVKAAKAKLENNEYNLTNNNNNRTSNLKDNMSQRSSNVT